MPVSFPLPTLKTQTNITSYSTNSDDHPILEKLSSLIPSFTQNKLSALSIITLSLAFEPDRVEVNGHFGNTQTFQECADLILDLSQDGKVALVRGIAELLSVSLNLPAQSQKLTLPLPSLQQKGAEQ